MYIYIYIYRYKYIHICVYVCIYIYIYIHRESTATGLHPVPITRLSLTRFVPRVGLHRDLFLIGSLTAALRLSKGWVRKNLNLVMGIGCKLVITGSDTGKLPGIFITHSFNNDIHICMYTCVYIYIYIFHYIIYTHIHIQLLIISMY